MTDDLDGLAVFAAVAEMKGFRAAGRKLGVSGSAVSQALRRFEERLGVTLVQRTTRSVRLTPAGEGLYAAARPALDELKAAVAAAGENADRPRGVLRLLISTVADRFLHGVRLAGFLAEYPEVSLDLVVSDAPLDIVAQGFDGGILLGEQIALDMIAVPVSGDIRLVVVGAPSYFARRRVPRHPRDLAEHSCLNWHPSPEAPPYRWEFTEDGRDFAMSVPTRVLSTDSSLNLRLAVAGAGVTMVYEDHAREYVERGELVTALERYCTPFPGYYLYYPQRRHASPALRALVDYLRRTRRTP